MEEGTIIAWLKADGDAVERGEALVEIETDKADMAYESPHAGVVKILVPEGETVPIGTPIAAIGAAADAAAEEPAAPEPAAAAPPEPAPAEPAAAPAPATAKGGATVQELTRTQQLVARRMAEAKATIPEFTVTCRVDVTAIVAERTRRKAEAAGDVVPSVNDFVLRACGRALAELPRANGSYRDGHWELHDRVNIGIAVATDDSLIVPTLTDADRKSLDEIAAASRLLAARVRSGEITPPELAGGTFTVSNLGMFGIESFTAVINPPQAAILAVGGIDGGRMALTLTCDHRILYGADAARFLARVRELLENPT